VYRTNSIYCEGELPASTGVNFLVKYQGPHIKQSPIRIKREDTEIINKIVDDQIAGGLLEELTNPNDVHYVSPAFVKKEANKYRLLVSYVRVNEHILRSTYELDDPEHQSATVAAGISWNLYDCKAGYNAVIIEEDSWKYLMFVIYGINGKPRYLIPSRMTMGISNCAECYSWILSRAFAEVPNAVTYPIDTLGHK